jgi:hypothetical protein
VVQAVRTVDGVRVTKVAGVTCYSQLDDTEVHDALRGAVRELIVSSSTVFQCFQSGRIRTQGGSLLGNGSIPRA